MTNKVAWIPCNSVLKCNRLFDPRIARDNAHERFVVANNILHEHGYQSNTIDMCDLKSVGVILFYGMTTDMRWLIKTMNANPNVRLINIPIEPPVISFLHQENILSMMPFDRILVWNDALVARGLPFVKANIGEAVIEDESIPVIDFEGKKFLVAIYSSKLVKHTHGLYEERLRAYDFFAEKAEGFDLYGMGWEQSSRPSVVASYRGKVETKKDVLQNYKFSICFENANGYLGLITEKIFDCFAAGTVPIYYGAPNVQDYIPKACFIDFRDFKDYDELYAFLVAMKEDEYQTYLDAVNAFIQTPAYYEFTSKRYAEVVLEQIQAVMNEDTPKRTVLGFKWSMLKIILRHPLLFLSNFKQVRRLLFDLVTAW